MSNEFDQERQSLKTGASSPQIHYVSIPINKGRERASTEFGGSSNGGRNHDEGLTPHTFGHNVQRRASILDQPIGSFKGVNSLSRFATSFQRANSFMAIEIAPDRERSYIGNDGDETYDPDTLAPSFDGRKLSLAITGPGTVAIRPSANDLYGAISRRASAAHPNIPAAMESAVEDYDGSQSIFSYDSMVPFPLRDYSFHDSGKALGPDADSVVLKQVETTDGKVITVLAGQSTAPQTIFNSVNVLIGIGLLSLPLGLKYAGWALGIPLLVIFAFATYVTAGLLSRCLDTDPSIATYGDLAFAAFGSNGRALISILFTLDLLACGVALIILFGDSLNALFPQFSVTFFKLVAFFAVTPPIFLPLNVLSNISLLGILSTIGTVVAVIFCGLYKQNAPGSLIQPEPTLMWPNSFKEFCLSIGLLSACWGGHAVFPNLKNDMRHPEKFKQCLKTTYCITILTDFGIAIVGFLMFGQLILNEVTKSVLLTPGYPKFFYGLISVLLSLIPIAKTPLNARPIVSILDSSLGVSHVDTSAPVSVQWYTKMLRILNRIAVNAIFVFVAIIFPEFDKLIAFLGAALCFLICFILPCLFYLRICHKVVKPWERLACNITIFVSVILGSLGVYAAFTF